MIRDFSSGKTKFVQMIVSAPDGRFSQEAIKGGLDLLSAKQQAKNYPRIFVIDIFDSKE